MLFAGRGAGRDVVFAPALFGRLAGVFFIFAALANAVSLAFPLPAGQRRGPLAAVSVAALAVGVVVWRLPWDRWGPAVMRRVVVPMAWALIGVAFSVGGVDPFSYGVTFALIFVWLGLGQPRWTSVRFAVPAAGVYVAPLLMNHHPAGDVATAVFVIPMCVGLAEGCGWVSERLATAQTELRVANAGVERLLWATTALARAETETEAADLTAGLAQDLLGADRTLVMVVESARPSRFVVRGQRNLIVDEADLVVDVGIEPSALGYVARTGRTLYLADAHSSELVSARLARLVTGASALFIPLPGEGGVLGAIGAVWDAPRASLDPFSQRVVEVLSAEAGRALERRQALAALWTSEEHRRSIIETAGDPYISMDETGRVREWNRQAEATFGWSREEAVGRTVADLIIPENQRDHHSEGLRRFLETGERAIIGRQVQLQAVTRAGREFPVEVTVWATRLGEAWTFNAFVRDISERTRLEAELTRQALHDSLTGLPNRTLFLDRLDHALARGARPGSAVTVLFLDLDGFKTVNDSLGHAAGDDLLVAVAGRLGGALRPADTIARLGGDEFAVLLEDTESKGGVVVAERLAAVLAASISIGGRQVFARASIGIATAESGERSAEELLRDADLAMYLAKGRGKGGHAIFEAGMHAAAVERLELEADLRRALALDELLLHYQPVVQLDDGAVVGTEALLRWRRQGQDLVSPGVFVPIAEETGVIVEFGRWVLNEACVQTAAWNREHPSARPLALSVNLSARQIHDPHIVADVAAALDRSNLDPSRLTLEITESVLMEDPEGAASVLNELRRSGVRVAVDDFGTGYSSLSYLRRFPIEVLKIDRSFVSAMLGGPEDAALAHAIVKLGDSLRLDVVAEGIETLEQLDTLRSLGCRYGQGYVFARPLTPEAMAAFLRDAGERPAPPR